MREEEFRKIAKEYAEIYFTKGIDSTKIFKYVDELEKKVEQLENIRKEAIKVTKDVKQFVYDELVDRNVSGSTETHCKIKDLLNILNKGSEDSE